MTITTDTGTLDRLLDPVRNCFTPEVAERIVALRAEPAVQARLDDLAEGHHEGRLTDDERAEYFGMVQAGNLIAVLQAKAKAVSNGR